jgi:hypothetical protein
MLRLVSLVIVALVVILALAVGAIRWIGQQRPAEIPLPESDGCWLSICFFGAMTLEDLPATLNVDPRIVDGSAALVPDLQPGGNYLLELQFARGGSTPWPVLLYWMPHTYTLVRDWRNPDNPPLWRVGDVIQAYGEPNMVSFLVDQVMFHYPAHHLQVVFDPAERDWGWARIVPEDAVISVMVIRGDIASGDATQVFYPPASKWFGFGLYRFDG